MIHREVNGQALGTVNLVRDDCSPLRAVHPGHLNPGVTTSISPEHQAQLGVHHDAGGFLQPPIHQSPLVPAVIERDEETALPIVNLRPVDLVCHPVVGDGCGLGLGHIAGLNILRISNLCTGVHFRDEGPLDGILLRVNPVDHVGLLIVVNARNPVLINDDVGVSVNLSLLLTADVAGRDEHDVLLKVIVRLADATVFVRQPEARVAGAGEGAVIVCAGVRAVALGDV